MSTAGVRLTSGQVVWVEAGGVSVQPLDNVVVDLGGKELQGQVIVAPEALLRPVQASGRVRRVMEKNRIDGRCAELGGADVPPLGTTEQDGIVIAVDAVNRTVTVEGSDGTRVTSHIAGKAG